MFVMKSYNFAKTGATNEWLIRWRFMTTSVNVKVAATSAVLTQAPAKRGTWCGRRQPQLNILRKCCCLSQNFKNSSVAKNDALCAMKTLRLSLFLKRNKKILNIEDWFHSATCNAFLRTFSQLTLQLISHLKKSLPSSYLPPTSLYCFSPTFWIRYFPNFNFIDAIRNLYELPKCFLCSPYRLQKPMLPLLMEADFSADGWLGFLVGNKLTYDMFEEDHLEKNMMKVFKELGGRGKASCADRHLTAPESETTAIFSCPASCCKESSLGERAISFLKLWIVGWQK